MSTKRTRRSAKQLELLARPRVAWPLDAGTRQRGLAGVARARRALDAARPPTERLRRAS